MDDTTDTSTGKPISRRAALGALGSGAVVGLAGCTRIATEGYGSDGDSGSTGTATGGSGSYTCPEDEYWIGIHWQDDVEAHHDKEPGYIADILKDELESDRQQGKLIAGTPYEQVRAEPMGQFNSEYDGSYALFEGPAYQEWINHQYEDGEERPQAHILLRDNTRTSLLGIAIMDWVGEHCHEMTQACTMNYSHLLQHYDEEHNGDAEFSPIIKDDEFVDQWLANALVGTGPHEVGHLGNLAHLDGLADREEDYDGEGNSRWFSSTMTAFYGIAFGQYGLSNNCGQDTFDMPEVMGGGLGGVTWMDDIYLKNEFSDCATDLFEKTVESGGDYPRDPIASIHAPGSAEFDILKDFPTDGVDVPNVWEQTAQQHLADPDLPDHGPEELAELWSGLEHVTVSANNFEDIKALADRADNEEDRQKVIGMWAEFRDQLKADFGDYKPVQSDKYPA